MRVRMTRLVALAGAVLGGAALLLQLVLTVNASGSVMLGVWRYAGYFTIIANSFTVLVLAGVALGRAMPRAAFAAATAMILVGVVYALLLRDTWNPQGWQKLADVILHDVMPLVMAAFWLLRPHPCVDRRAIALSLVLPLSYLGYGLVRGAFEGWYAYGFLDVGMLGAGAVAINCTVMGLAFLVMALLLALLDRALP